MFRAQSLIEFPPAVAYGRLYFANNAGVMFAIGKQNGLKAWSFKSHRCQAASPAVDRHLVFQVFLNTPPCNRPYSSALTGELIAFNAGSGTVAWRKTIGPSETSPAVVHGVVYVGDWSGRVYAFAERTGQALVDGAAARRGQGRRRGRRATRSTPPTTRATSTR